MSTANLVKNNQSMKTVVETFIVEETSELIHDNDKLQQWNDKVEELQLEGQKTIVVSGKSPVPFLWMNSAIVSTFETLCPTKVLISKYSKTPIPIEILELASLSIKEKYFDKIEIWYNEKEVDPVCIGYKNDPKQKGDWAREFYAAKYLIGRWADVKESLDSLVKSAKLVFIQNRKTELTLSIRNKQRELEDLEQECDTKFGNAMPSTDLPF